MTDTPTRQKVAAEVIGTFVLVLFGCGSAVFATETLLTDGFVSTATTVGLTFGLALMVMIYAVGRVSGAHFNPAVSVGAAMGGRLPWNQVPVYVASQLAGAILGATVLFGLLHGFEGFDAEGNMGQNAFGSESPANYALWAALLLELVLTMVFVWVILAVTDERNEHPALAPVAIGFTLVAIYFVAIPATGGSVNPARSIGPALFAGGDAIAQVWLFVVAPLLGGAVAGLTYPLLFGHGSDPVIGSGLRFGRPGGAVPGYGAPDQYQQQWAPTGQQEPAPAATASAWGEHQWTPEQIAAWEAQQAQATQQWTPEQIAAWEAQQAQAAQQPQQGGWPTAPGDDDGEAERTQIRPPR
ncbi:MAG: MIP family channel protein [Nocardioides sp.]